MATNSGLGYFDGLRFTNFRHEPNEHGTLSSNMVNNVFTDSIGTCWFSTSSGVQVFDYENSAFIDVPLQYPFGFDTYYANSIVESPDKKSVLVSVPGIGVMVYDSETYKINRETTEQLINIYGLKYIGILFFDSDNYLWNFNASGDLFRLNYQEKTIKKHLWSPELSQISKKIEVSAIEEDPVTKNLLIGTYNHGLFIYDRSIGHIRKPKGTSSAKYQIRSLLAETVATNGSELNLWIGTENAGLKKFDWEKEEIIVPYFKDSPIDLNNCKIHSLIQDNQGNIWVGVFQKGLLVIPRASYNFEYLKLSRDQSSMDENSACATSIIRDLDSNLWIGTDGGGLFRISKNGEASCFTSENSSLPNNNISSLTFDKRGTIWISTNLGGITTYNNLDGFRSYSEALDLQKIHCSLYDSINDKIYFGTNGSGVKVLSIIEKKVVNFPDSIKTGWFNSLFLDQSGVLWGGGFKGFRCYDTLSGIEKHTELADSLTDCIVYSFYENLDGSVWIGTDKGLFLYKKEKKAISHYSQKSGLPHSTIFGIQKSAEGKLWLSTGHGLSCLDPQSGKFENFYAYDGLQDNEFRKGASFKDRDGRIFFGGINGVSSFYPEKIKERAQALPNVYFTKLKVLNKTVFYDQALGDKNILDSHISKATQVTLNKSQNVFSLEFNVLEYTNPKKVVYGYMLEGFDKDWSYSESNQRFATYTNLPDGKYTFRVKAFYKGNSNEENVVHNQIDLLILPPWYKTWWAYLIYLLLFVATVWQIANWRIRKKKRKEERLEFEKKELKLRMFTDLSHEIRTPLTLVMNPLKSMRESETDTKRKDLFNLMYRNSLRILRLINQLMDMRKIDNHQLQMRFNKTDLIFIVQDIMKSFDQVTIVRNIDFRLLTNMDKLDVWIDQSNFDKVLFNIISNAFKYTPDNGHIYITIDSFVNNKESGLKADVSEYVELSIENSGSFINENELARIFDRFYQIGNSNTGGSGIGLHLAKKIVSFHHGTITAKNVEKGVAFTVRIPLGKSHLSDKELSVAAKYKELYSDIRADEKLPKETEYVPTSESEGETVSKISKSKKTLVFVDDDVDLGKYIKMELSGIYNVEVFVNANDAWKVISTTIPDIIVTDLIMPEVDGIALCKKIRQNPETNFLPIIVLTSQDDEETEQACIKSGADSYLTKPLSLELLKVTLTQAIKTRETIRNKYRTNLNIDFNEVQIKSPDSQLVAKVIETIRKNIDNHEFSVEDLSKEVGLSRVHLNRKLKENINISPNNLIKSIRLKQAAYLLLKNKVNVSDVAYKVGFSTPSYFTNNFREYFGMTPSEFVSKYMDLDDKNSLNKLFESKFPN